MVTRSEPSGCKPASRSVSPILPHELEFLAMENSALTRWMEVGTGGNPIRSPSNMSLLPATTSSEPHASVEVAPSRNSEGGIPAIFVTNVSDVIGFSR